MKRCLHCNEECDDSVSICPKCGAMVDTYVDHKEYMDVYHVNHGKKLKNYKLILWFLLGVILPYIGFLVCWILYDSDRDKAKSILLGAIVSSLITAFLPYALVWFMGDEGNDGNGNNNVGEQIKILMDIYNSL